MISVTDTLNPVTGTPLTYRAATTYNNSWNWNHPLPGGGVLHHRIPRLQGGLQQRVPASRQHDLQRAGDAVQLQLHLDGAHRDHLPNRAPHRRSQRQSRHGALRAGQVDDRTVDAVGRASASTPSRTASRSSRSSGTFFGRNLNIQYDKIDNLSWNDVTPRLGATYDVFGNGKTAFKVTLNKYLEGLGTTGIRARAGVGRAQSGQSAAEHDTARLGRCQPRLHPGLRSEQLRGERRVPGARQRRDLRHRHTGHELRPGPDDRVGKAGVQLGVHDQRPAGDHASHVDRRAVRPAVVRQHSRHGRPVRHAGRATRRSRLPRPRTHGCRTAADTR